MTLKITVGGKEYVFNGPYSQTADLKSDSGTYVVTTKKKSGDHKIIDVGESANVKSRVENHDRADCWANEQKNGLFYSGYYCDETSRMKLGDDIRNAFSPPCGER